ncbi:ATP-dependent protease hslV [Phytophthora infestans T30-4]|uniref:ATP-dependent protease hslV n=1 Tax=Phytophthora infestans (strain T30-4) TaxID=403677 RepID=D0MWX9_PHYIT|nr:ATP-dependent protease hslV [Phytophthora infestans T30-4]EEY64142.1 ATP-dependent protease hslV [Phytophthora infestans T30-4]|eukprot:XP_002907578.1 ATP-dependent protease hslV [Phytophthora infestans T30-4]
MLARSLFRAASSVRIARFSDAPTMHGTTILCVRKNGKVCLIGDGQVSLGHTVVKPNAKKVRRIGEHIVAGFAGSTADAFTLMERLEAKLDEYPGQLTRSCVELAKDWRTDKYLRRLEAILIVSDINQSYTLTGNGDVLEPHDGIIGIGSGGTYALAAARALIDQDLDAETIGRKAMKIAADICVYTNGNVVVEMLEEGKDNSKEEKQEE